MDEQAWREKSVEILTDVKEWRRAHPKATYVEIEDKVHRRMMELEAQILQDAASASESRAWGKTLEQPAALCPTCAVPLQARGKQKRTRAEKWRTTSDVEQNLRDLPQMWSKSFPPWMR